MKSLEIISTEKVSPSKRPAVWQHALREKLGLHSRVDPVPDFDAKLEHINVADIGFFRLTASGYYVERTAHLAERDGTSCAKIALQLRGTSYFEQKNRRVSLLPGEWTIWDNTKPYCSSNPGGVQLLVVTVPKERICKGLFDLDEMMLHKFSGTSGVGKLVFQFNAAAFEEIPAIRGSYESDLADIIVHLVSLTVLEASRDCMYPSPRELLCERIKSNILENLRDPDLNIARIADDLGCSRRYLHKAFESEGVSLSDYIWRARLLRCYEQLRNNRDRESITQIAFSWGFNSSAHFSTRFKKYFGQAPREYRSGLSALSGDPPFENFDWQSSHERRGRSPHRK